MSGLFYMGKLHSDTKPFWRAVKEARSFLSGSPAGLARLDILLDELSPDLFETRLVSTCGADDDDFTLVVLPGPDLEALMVTFGANAHNGMLPE